MPRMALPPLKPESNVPPAPSIRRPAPLPAPVLPERSGNGKTDPGEVHLHRRVDQDPRHLNIQFRVAWVTADAVNVQLAEKRRLGPGTIRMLLRSCMTTNRRTGN